jgi:hypothetical protein
MEEGGLGGERFFTALLSAPGVRSRGSPLIIETEAQFEKTRSLALGIIQRASEGSAWRIPPRALRVGEEEDVARVAASQPAMSSDFAASGVR